MDLTCTTSTLVHLVCNLLLKAERRKQVLQRLQEEGNGFNTDIIRAVEYETIKRQSLNRYFLLTTDRKHQVRNFCVKCELLAVILSAMRSR